ncbi:YpuI family protein [Neobacillus sp. LXY-4]|uniref:YpuI family protein n=1 Tax=Neobacillus sp. LXY-4 TaxID=3379826 RepID=UPI003EE38CD4
MGNTIAKAQIEDVKYFLAKTSAELEEFLNENTLSGLLEKKPGNQDYYKLLLGNIRKLLVYCEESLDSCKVILQTETFPKAAAEKTLYRIYHQCIEEFFSPKSDVWFEDSRSAYTGKNSIKLRHDAPDNLKKLIAGLEGEFQRVREELQYYETDYLTKIMQSK